MEVINYAAVEANRNLFPFLKKLTSHSEIKRVPLFYKRVPLNISENIETILKVLAVILFGLLFAICTFSAVGYTIFHTGPLVFDKNAPAADELLVQAMQTFALDEEAIFASELLQQDIKESNSIVVIKEPVSYQTYKVKDGDTISGITKKFGLNNISTLIAVNDIDNVRQLGAGQKLKIPSMDGLIYTVKTNNSLSGISAKFNVAVEDLLDVNELDSEVLYVGQQLFIPGARLDLEKLQQAMGTFFTTPITAKFKITSYFGPRADPFTGVQSYHTGIDLACPLGTPILATCTGKVVYAGWSNIYGNYVIMRHSNGYQTLYGHLHQVFVKKGQNITQGTKIGSVGSTGYSTGPHLHFTIFKNGKLVNPINVVKLK